MSRPVPLGPALKAGIAEYRPYSDGLHVVLPVIAKTITSAAELRDLIDALNDAADGLDEVLAEMEDSGV